MAQSQTKTPVILPAGRGTIFDQLGTPLALGEQATTVYANPRQIANPRAAARAVERTLGLDANRVYPLLADRSHGFVYVARQADPAQAAALQHKKLPGFGFYPEEHRSYPQRSVAAQLLGYVGIDGNGLAGLELQLDRELAGRAGTETVVKDPDSAGRFRGRISSSRSTTASRRTRRKCCGRPFASGERRAPLRSCSTPAPVRFSRWRYSRVTTRTDSQLHRATCSGIARSQTPMSRARRSS